AIEAQKDGTLLRRRCSARSLNYRIEGRFGPAVAIEQEWVVGSSPYGPVVQPGTGISDTPNSYAGEGSPVFEKHPKQIGIPLRQRLLDRIRQPVRVRIQFGL